MFVITLLINALICRQSIRSSFAVSSSQSAGMTLRYMYAQTKHALVFALLTLMYEK